MTKEELKEKRNRTIESLNDIKAILGLDELYIDELEKENEELRNNGFTVSAMTEQQLKAALEKGKQLEKEVEEILKNKTLENAYKQLTKAKELLNEFMRISKASYEDFEHDYSELIGEAEQFLSEVKK